MWRVVGSLARDSAIYGCANAGSAMLAVLLVPIYTHGLTVSEFGTYSLVVMVYGLLSVLADCGLTNSVARYYFNEAETSTPELAARYRSSLITTALATTGTISLILGIVCYWSADAVSWKAFGVATYGPPLRIIGVTLCLRGLTTAPMIHLRVTGRAVAYGLVSVLQGTVLLVSALVFVLVLGWGVPGILYSQLLSTGAWAAGALVVVARDLTTRLRTSIARDLLKFGLPLLPALPLMWVIDVSDRYLVEWFGSTQEVGLYALGYRFGHFMVFLVSAVTLAWPAFNYRILDQPDGKTIYARIASLYLAGAGMVWLAMSLFAEDMIGLLAAREFHPAAIYIAPVAFGYLLYGLYVFTVTGLGVVRRNGPISWMSLIAAVANVGLNVWLIPVFGPLVAAYTTIVAYGILVAGCLWASQRAYWIPFRYHEWAALMAGMVTLSAVWTMLPAMPWVIGAVVRMGLLAVYATLTVFAGVVSQAEIWTLAGSFLNRASRVSPVGRSESEAAPRP
jgi:O-antigen/teichoic acid export membrane protein